jgi:cytoskeletal protein RodZ
VTPFGEYLKRERNAKNVSLADLSQATKIPLRTLERLEAGEVDALPAPVFVRGFVKAYARHLRLDEQIALGELDKWNEALSAPLVVPEPPPLPAGDRAVPLHARSRVGGVALLVLVIVLVVVAARWLN